MKDILDGLWNYQPLAAPGYTKAGNVAQNASSYASGLGLDLVDVAGKSYMDVGAAEGWACFWAEEHGATNVVALDGCSWKYHTPETNGFQDAILVFALLHRLRKSKVKRLVVDVESGDFVDSVRRISGVDKIDIVTCCGVLYHTPNPVTAIRNVYEVTGETAVFNVPDFSAQHKSIFTPYTNPRDPSSSLLNWGGQNNHIINLGLEDWKAMMLYAGFKSVQVTPKHGMNLYKASRL